ncbi:MAG: beta-N-acetylglucosaminidase [Capnocytophaga sp.]|nr:beta-N-acetylglucosaminidase [Capnocytophaga sp.]
MKNLLLSFVFLFSLTGEASTATAIPINPTPQNVQFSGKTIVPTQFKVKNNGLSPATASLLNKILIGKEGKKHTVNVIVGTKNQSSVKKYSQKIPNKPEGYYLLIDEKNIVIAGNDERGTYYGVRTLEQLLKSEKLPLGEITDSPDLPSRGVVEGFYGTPWSHEKRLRQLDFYGENKLNTYIYGPKDDPYHSSPNWRLAYPAGEAAQIKELVQRANDNFVDFVWAIHPGKDIQWNDEDRQNLLRKFELMYGLGVRAFAVFFDDISGEGTNPEKQAELLNFLHEKFVAVKKDVNPLIMCPTEYNKSWSNPEKKYLETLGGKLHPSVEIMWTGDRVVADIDAPTLAWINAKIKRKAYIWWNFPVSDYVRNHMLLGPAYGNANDIKNEMSGFVSNPMEHPEASKIAIYGVADYTWNLEKYNPETAWVNAIKTVLPEHHEALLTFAKHNSDLGPNGHRYRRDESVAFKPIAEAFLSRLNQPQNPQKELVTNEFDEIVKASEELLSNMSTNRYLLDELLPWLLQFRLQGKLGQQMMNMYEALDGNQPHDFENTYTQVLDLQKKIFTTDQTHNQNPYQPGVKTGTLVIEPLINQTLTHLIKKYNETYGRNLKLALNFNPNKLITNSKQLENQPLLQKGKSVRISPVLEYASVQKNEYIGIELEKNTDLKAISVDFGNEKAFSDGIIQISTNGTDWQTVNGNVKNGRWNNSETLQNVKFVRYISTTDAKQDLQLKQFEITFN